MLKLVTEWSGGHLRKDTWPCSASHALSADLTIWMFFDTSTRYVAWRIWQSVTDEASRVPRALRTRVESDESSSAAAMSISLRALVRIRFIVLMSFGPMLMLAELLVEKEEEEEEEEGEEKVSSFITSISLLSIPGLSNAGCKWLKSGNGLSRNSAEVGVYEAVLLVEELVLEEGEDEEEEDKSTTSLAPPLASFFLPSSASISMAESFPPFMRLARFVGYFGASP